MRWWEWPHTQQVRSSCDLDDDERYTQVDFLMSRAEHNFIAIEDQPFTNPPLTPHILYILTVATFTHITHATADLLSPQVRQPLDRILSHFRHHRKDHKLLNYSFPTFAAKQPPEYWASNWYSSSTATLSFRSHPSFHKLPPLKSCHSRYLQILGDCYGRGCTADDLPAAMHKLDLFTLILITDTPLHYR